MEEDEILDVGLVGIAAFGSDAVPDERSYTGTVEASEILAKIEKGEDVEVRCWRGEKIG